MSVSGLGRRVARLEDIASPSRTIVVIHYDDGYCVDGKVMAEDAFNRWIETLSKNVHLLIVKMWGNAKIPPKIAPPPGQIS